MQQVKYFTTLITLALLTITACSKQQDSTGPAFTPDQNMVQPPANPANNLPLNKVVQDNSGKTVLYWYDPMVADKHFDKPGKSPFMDMQLEPKYAQDANQGNKP